MANMAYSGVNKNCMWLNNMDKVFKTMLKTDAVQHTADMHMVDGTKESMGDVVSLAAQSAASNHDCHQSDDDMDMDADLQEVAKDADQDSVSGKNVIEGFASRVSSRSLSPSDKENLSTDATFSTGSDSGETTSSFVDSNSEGEDDFCVSDDNVNAEGKNNTTLEARNKEEDMVGNKSNLAMHEDVRSATPQDEGRPSEIHDGADVENNANKENSGDVPSASACTVDGTAGIGLHSASPFPSRSPPPASQSEVPINHHSMSSATASPPCPPPADKNVFIVPPGSTTRV